MQIALHIKNSLFPIRNASAQLKERLRSSLVPYIFVLSYRLKDGPHALRVVAFGRAEVVHLTAEAYSAWQIALLLLMRSLGRI